MGAAGVAGTGSAGTSGTRGLTGIGGAGAGGETGGGTGTAGSTGAGGPGGNGGSVGSAGTTGGRGGAGGIQSGGRGGSSGVVGGGGKGGGSSGVVGGSGGGSAIQPDGSTAPTFTEIYKTILTDYCTGSGCHEPGTAGGLGFATQASAFAALSHQVTAGDGIDSDLYVTLDTGVMPKGKPKLSAANIALVREWIDAGALDN